MEKENLNRSNIIYPFFIQILIEFTGKPQKRYLQNFFSGTAVTISKIETALFMSALTVQLEKVDQQLSSISKRKTNEIIVNNLIIFYQKLIKNRKKNEK